MDEIVTWKCHWCGLMNAMRRPCRCIKCREPRGSMPVKEE